MRAAVPTALALALLAVAIPGRGEQPPSANDFLQAVEAKLKAVSESAGPAVACVVASRSDQYPKPKSQEHPGQLGGFDPVAFAQSDPTPTRVTLARKLDLSHEQNIPDHGWSGGVVVDASGLVLTTYHAVEEATKIYVHLPGGRGSYADIHAADSRCDLAVLKLLTPPPGLHAVPLGEVRTTYLNPNLNNVASGRLLVLMAYPYSSGFEMQRPTAWLGSVGTVLQVRPQVQNGPPQSLSWYRFGTMIEFNTIVMPAGKGAVAATLTCDGAPAFGLDGELLGLTTTMAAIVGNFDGPVYVLPIDPNIRRIIEVLCRGEEVEYGLLGVVVQDTGGFRNELALSGITPRGPAALAGITVNDTIVQIDGKPVRRFSDLLLHAGTALAGSRIKMTLRNGRNLRDVDVVLAKIKNEAPFIASKRPEPVFGLRVDYGSVAALTSATGVPRGVLVRDLVPDSPAEKKFKALGDNPTRWLITRVNDTAVNVPNDFYAAARGQAAITLKIADMNAMAPMEQELILP